MFTLGVTIIAALIGILLGIILTFARMSNEFLKETKYRKMVKFNPLYYFSIIYVDVVRGTPVIVQLLIIYYLLFVGSLANTPKLIIAGIAFGLNSGAYVSEILRSGIQSLDKGQMEAARALGMPYKLAMFSIILPQAVVKTLPTLVSEFIVLLKETSVVGFIGASDLLRSAETITSRTYNGIIPLLAVAVIYLILTSVFTIIMRLVEKGVSRND